uniref:Dehydrogenase n=1 Tax=Pristionchus pacificus TaxID=54126 RepID=A0A8R1Z9M1_PRIPA
MICLIALLIQFLWIFCKIFGPYFLCRRKDLHKLAGAKWAVVTGASDGIGKAFAYELARMKFNIILISRCQSKLDLVAKELEGEFPEVKFRIIVFDFTASKIEEYQPLFDELYSYEIGVLVNNVGMTMPCPEILHKVRGDKDELARISTVNTLPMLMLSSAVLEYMALRKKGIIINITTGFALSDAPLWNVYSASKNYALHLSRTLRREYSSYGITIQTLTPMRVFTKSIVPKVDKPSFFVPSAENYARSALKTVGNVNETAGYCAHQLQVKLSENAGQY